jgi:flagellar biosynthesis protein FlhB
MADAHSEERTESPTPRRIQQARRGGQTAISRDLGAALAMATACGVLALAAQAGVAGLVLAMREALEGATQATAFSAAIGAGLEVVVLTLAPPVGLLWVVAWLVGVVQTRGLATTWPLRPDASRLLPSLSRMFGRDRAIEAGKGAIALGSLFAVAVWTLRPATFGVAVLGGASAAQVLRAVGTLGERLSIHLVVTTLALGAADLLWRRHHHGKALRMSRDEVKRELRESEGEPAHKAERLRLHRECMLEQTLGDIPRADFVVVNAGVMAAAIGYDPENSSAPIVMVKGERRSAQAIEESARVAGVPVFVEAELVRALVSVDDGGEIPEELYAQVAEWLVQARALGRPDS